MKLSLNYSRAVHLLVLLHRPNTFEHNQFGKLKYDSIIADLNSSLTQGRIWSTETKRKWWDAV